MSMSTFRPPALYFITKPISEDTFKQRIKVENYMKMRANRDKPNAKLRGGDGSTRPKQDALVSQLEANRLAKIAELRTTSHRLNWPECKQSTNWAVACACFRATGSVILFRNPKCNIYPLYLP